MIKPVFGESGAGRTVRKLDLVDEQVDDRARVCRGRLPVALLEGLDRLELLEKVELWHVAQVPGQPSGQGGACVRRVCTACVRGAGVGVGVGGGGVGGWGGGAARPRTASMTVTSVSRRQNSSRRLPRASSNVNVSATGMGSAMPAHTHGHPSRGVGEEGRGGRGAVEHGEREGGRAYRTTRPQRSRTGSPPRGAPAPPAGPRAACSRCSRWTFPRAWRPCAAR